MYRFLSVIVKKARKEKHLTQEDLIRKIGAHQISIRTLQRIERGDLAVKEELANIILDYFDIELWYRLRDEYEEKIVEDFLTVDTDDSRIKESIDEANAAICEYRTLFHGEENWMHHFPITNLAQFLIYFPLIDPNQLYDCLRRIGGDFQGRFYYALEKCEYLYDMIPDSHYKATADKLVKRVFDRDYMIAQEDLEAYRQLLEDKANVYAYFRDAHRLFLDIKRKETCTDGGAKGED